MTYRFASALAAAALFGAACAPAKSDDSPTGSDDGTGESGDGDAGGDGDGDEVSLGTGGLAGAGGNILGGDGDVLGDGDGDGDGGDGDGDADPPGDGDADPPGDGDGDAVAGTGGASEGSGGSASSSGGTPAIESCTENEAGTFVVEGETVFDEKTCLTWMRDNTTGDPYAEAVAYCDALVLGGYEDWRIPTAGEVGTIFKCDGMWPPIDDTIFNVMGDGIWTTTETGTIAGDLPKVCGAGQSSGSFYDFGQVGGQNTRCVRGTSTVPDRSDCITDSAICQ